VRFGRISIWLVAAALAAAGCSTPPAQSAPEPEKLTIGGKTVLDGPLLQAQAEEELGFTLNFGYVARAGSRPVDCWFARTNSESEVDTRLWCGPVQVPGTGATVDWVPVPLKETKLESGGARFEVQPPQIPANGTRSSPVGSLVRSDGRESDPNKEEAESSEAGPDFLAVLPDDGKSSNESLGLTAAPDLKVRDDLLSATATGWGTPDSFPNGKGNLKPGPGLRLRVLRLKVEQLLKTDPAFDQLPWQGYTPQPSELALELPGRRQQLPADRLPENNTVFVVYTVATGTVDGESLALNTIGTKSLEQRVELPSGKTTTEVPRVLRRPAGPAKQADVKQKIEVGGKQGELKVLGVRLGRQRPVKVNGEYQVVTASAPDKALLELRISAKGDGFPDTVGGDVTKGLFKVTLPDGSVAPQVGIRYDGGPFPVALVVEVPADARSVALALEQATVTLPIVGSTSIAPVDGPATIPLDF
jgi:hypothetical protein